MMRASLLIFGVLFGGMITAAPIPKALKKTRSTDYEGVWELVGYNYDGVEKALSNGKYWEVTKSNLYFGMPTVDERRSGLEGPLKTPDENRPQYKEYSSSTCLLELNGDELKWIFCQEKPETLTICEPGKGRHLYTFKRAK